MANPFQQTGEEVMKWSPFGQGDAGTSGALPGFDPLGKQLDKINPTLQSKNAAKKKKQEDDARAAALDAATRPINQALDQADITYKGAFDKESLNYLNKAEGIAGNYKAELNKLKDQATSQANDNTQTYTNTIFPALKDLLEKSKINADSAMTLEEYADPENELMTAIREMYNKKGQQARQQGQQDYGILAALGAQAAQGQIGAPGGNPMTAGMQGQIYAANQRQAGDAYSRAQQRMYDLEDQGLEKSWDQNDKVYKAGQDALNMYGDSAMGISEAEKNYYDTQGGFRDELAGYAGDITGVDTSLAADYYNMGMTGAGIDKGNVYAGKGREQSALNQKYGNQQVAADNKMAADMANYKNQGQFYSQLAQMFAGGMSDETAKTNIAEVSDSDLDEFLDAVQPKTFEYKDESMLGALPGKRIGFMLQDVQGTKLGDEMTFVGPHGKLMYDRQNLEGILLAALKRERAA